MADEQIVISVSDNIAPSIATKLQSIEVNALQAMDAFTRMQLSIDRINGSSFDKLATTAAANGAQFGIATSGTRQYAAAISSTAGRVQGLTTAIIANTAALVANNAASGGTANIFKQLNQSTTQAAGGLGTFTGSSRSATAALSVLRGNMQGGTRAAGLFLSSVLGLGPALQLAFPIIGAIALIEIIGQTIVKFNAFRKAAEDAPQKIAEAYQKATDSARASADTLILENDRLQQQIDKLLNHPGKSSLSVEFDLLAVGADKVTDEVNKANDAVRALLENKKLQVGFTQSVFSNQASTGSTDDFLKSQQDTFEKISLQQESLVALAQDTKDINIIKAAEAERIKVLNQGNKDYQNAVQKRLDITKSLQSSSKPTSAGQTASDLLSTFTTGAGGVGGLGSVLGDISGKDQQANLNKLQGTLNDLKQNIRVINAQDTNTSLTSNLDKIKIGLEQTRDAAKAAAAQLKAYEDQFHQLEINKGGTGAGGLVTAQDKLKFFTDKRNDPGTSSLNFGALDAQRAGAQQSITEQANKQAEAVKQLTEKYTGLIAQTFVYGSALRELHTSQEIDKELTSKGIELNSLAAIRLRDLGRQAANAAQLHSEFEKVVKETIEPLDTFNLKQESLIQLWSAGNISLNQYVQAMDVAQQEYNKSVDPLLRLNQSLDEQQKLYGLVGNELAVATAMRQAENAITEKYGKAGLSTFATQLKQYRSKLEIDVSSREIQAQLNTLYSNGADTTRRLQIQQEALNQAKRQGNIISAEQYKIASAQNQADQATDRLKQGSNKTVGGAAKDTLGGALGGLLQNIKPLQEGLKEAFSGSLLTATNGFADSLGRSLVYAKNLGAALKDVARQAIAELISALVKLGIQQLALFAEQKLFSAAQSAVTSTTAAASALAWAPAAYLASVATLGGADAIGVAALLSGLAVTTAVSAGIGAVAGAAGAAGHRDGGLIYGAGTGRSDSIPAWLSNGEFVMNATSTKKYLPTLQAMNNGAAAVRASSGGTSFGGSMKVNVIHDGSTNIDVQQVTEDQVHIIATNVAKQIVTSHAPGVIAGDLQNPNSRTSKAIVRNTTAGIRR